MFSVQRYLGDEDVGGENEREAKLQRLKDKLSKKKKPTGNNSADDSTSDALRLVQVAASAVPQETKSDGEADKPEATTTSHKRRKGLPEKIDDSEKPEEADLSDVAHNVREEKDGRKKKRRRADSEPGEGDKPRKNAASTKVGEQNSISFQVRDNHSVTD
jgi:hypothetical protein